MEFDWLQKCVLCEALPKLHEIMLCPVKHQNSANIGHLWNVFSWGIRHKFCDGDLWLIPVALHQKFTALLLRSGKSPP